MNPVSAAPKQLSQARLANVTRTNEFRKSPSITTKNLISITSPDGRHTAVISPDFGANVLSFRVGNQADQLGTEIAYTPLDLQKLPENPSKLRMSEIGGLTPFMFPPGRTTKYAGESTLEEPFKDIRGLFKTAQGTPIHGGLFNRAWDVSSGTEDSGVTFALNTSHSENYDLRAVYGDIKIERTYILTDSAQLKIITKVTNNNPNSIDIAWGSHSYFNTPDRDSWHLEAPASHKWVTDPTTNEPTGKLVENTQFNIKTSLYGQKSDTIFTGLTPSTKGTMDSFLSRNGGPVIGIYANGVFQHRCVFLPYDTPENGGRAKPFMCVESQTSSADSFADHMPKGQATPVRLPGTHRKPGESNFKQSIEIIEVTP